MVDFRTSSNPNNQKRFNETILHAALVRPLAAWLKTIPRGILDRHPVANSTAQNQLQQYQKSFPDVDLSHPVTSAHGQCCFNLRLVLVNHHRWIEIRSAILEKLSRMIDRVASKYGHRISRAGLPADHVHLTIGCVVDQSPEDVALSYLNNLAYTVGMTPNYQFEYSVGTIGEYDRGAVSACRFPVFRCQTRSPLAQSPRVCVIAVPFVIRPRPSLRRSSLGLETRKPLLSCARRRLTMNLREPVL